MIRSDEEHLDDLLEHLRNVREGCIRIGKAEIKMGRFELGRDIIVSGIDHDLDKFFGLPWKEMRKGANIANPRFLAAVENHREFNDHHPQYWGSIHKMEEKAIAVMVSDWGARAAESRTCLQDYIDGRAMKEYGYVKSDPIYDKIMHFKRILCDEPFQAIKTV